MHGYHECLKKTTTTKTNNIKQEMIKIANCKLDRAINRKHFQKRQTCGDTKRKI